MPNIPIISMLITLLVVCISPRATADPVLVVKKSFPLNTISKAEASELWLAKTKSIGGLRPIFAVDLVDSHPLRKEFYEQVVGLSGRPLEIYWDKKLFSGKVVKPKTVATELDVIQMVTSISGVVGYVDSDSVNIDLKVLTITD